MLNRYMAGVHSTTSRTRWISSPLLVLKSLAPVLRRRGTRLRILMSSLPPPRPNWWPWNGSVPACAGAVASLTRCAPPSARGDLDADVRRHAVAPRRAAVRHPLHHPDSAFARWTRLGLWRRLGQRLALDWRIACGDEALPSALVVDSRSQRSSPTCFARGIDGGKNIKGIKLHVVCDKHGSLIDLEVTPANHDDRASALPMCPASLNWASRARLAYNGYKGEPFAAAGRAHDIWRFRSRLEEHPTASSSPVAFSLGGRAPIRLAFTLSQAQYCVRPQPRSLCLPHLVIAIISILARRLLRSQDVDLQHI